MHTALLLDALFAQIADGSVMPSDSYRFVKGETEQKIIRPLDFAAENYYETVKFTKSIAFEYSSVKKTSQCYKSA